LGRTAAAPPTTSGPSELLIRLLIISVALEVIKYSITPSHTHEVGELHTTSAYTPHAII
jgi:hypothetical protein